MQPPTKTEVRRALVIATTDFSDPQLRRLKAPGNDARSLAAALESPEVGGFEVKQLVNSSAQQVRIEIEELFADRHRDDLLLLYFSCHGIKDEFGSLYFGMADSNTKRLKSSAVAASFVNEVMQQSRSRRQVLILDCCYSGAFAQGMIAKSDPRINTEGRFTGHGRVVLTASDAVQYSFENNSDDNGPVTSVFTRALTHGLTSGEADLDKDGRITLDELYDYTFEKVLAETPAQTPSRWNFGVQGGITIAKNRCAKTATPSVLPLYVIQALSSDMELARQAGARELGRLLRTGTAVIAVAAEERLRDMLSDSSMMVLETVRAALVPPPVTVAAESPVASPQNPHASEKPELISAETRTKRWNATVCTAIALGAIAVLSFAVWPSSKHVAPKLDPSVTHLGTIGAGIVASEVPAPAPATKTVEPPVPAPTPKTYGTVRLRTDPPGALVAVEGEISTWTTPLLDFRLPTGSQKLKISVSGYRSKEITVLVAENGMHEVPLMRLERKMGRLNIPAITPDSTVTIESVSLDAPQAPLRFQKIPPAIVEDIPTGVYRATMIRPRWPAEEVEITIEENEVVALNPVFPRGELGMTSYPDGVEVFEGQTSLGRTPMLVEMPVGEHLLVARHSDWPDASQTRSVEINSKGTVKFAWNASALRVTSTTPNVIWALTSNDTKFANGLGGQNNFFLLPLNGGPYQLRVSAPFYYDKTIPLYLIAQESLGQQVDLEPNRPAILAYDSSNFRLSPMPKVVTIVRLAEARMMLGDRRRAESLYQEALVEEAKDPDNEDMISIAGSAAVWHFDKITAQIRNKLSKSARGSLDFYVKTRGLNIAVTSEKDVLSFQALEEMVFFAIATAKYDVVSVGCRGYFNYPMIDKTEAAIEMIGVGAVVQAQQLLAPIIKDAKHDAVGGAAEIRVQKDNKSLPSLLAYTLERTTGAWLLLKAAGLEVQAAELADGPLRAFGDDIRARLRVMTDNDDARSALFNLEVLQGLPGDTRARTKMYRELIKGDKVSAYTALKEREGGKVMGLGFRDLRFYVVRSLFRFYLHSKEYDRAKEVLQLTGNTDYIINAHVEMALRGI